MPSLVPVDHDPFNGERGSFSLAPVEYDPFAAEQFANPAVKGMMAGLATLPRRAIENSAYSLQSGNYDPGPTLEAATLPMGTGAIAGVPVRAGEVVLGSGAVRGVNSGAMPAKSIFDEVAEKYPQIKIDGSMPRSPNDYGVLSRIEVPKELRGQGIATSAMQDIIAAADERGVNLALSPSGDFGASPARLKDFYSRFGFVPNKGKYKDFATSESMLRPFAETNSAVAGPVPAATPTIRAYHGSPHDFDAFSMDKIGTGEGAQAYGHGLYFADNEGVAKGYRDALSGMGADMSNPEHVAAIYAQGQSDTPTAIAALRHNANNFSAGDAIHPDVLNRAADLLESGATPKKPGHMYEVNINADPAHFLDWDKPLSQQTPQVQDAISRLGKKEYLTPDPRSGYDAYDSIKNALEGSGKQNAASASQLFSEHGIPGIKYLDQGSRGAGQGSSNYVVFNHDLINIVRKYAAAGIALPPAIAAEYQSRFKPVDHDPFEAK